MALIDIYWTAVHHIYKDVWILVVDEGLSCKREEGNISDPYAVAISKSGNIVGHLPCRILLPVTYSYKFSAI